MTTKVITWTRPDGHVCITAPVPHMRYVFGITMRMQPTDPAVPYVFGEPMTLQKFNGFRANFPYEIVTTNEEEEQAFLERVAIKSLPVDAQNIEYVERDTVPTSRLFRNSWRKTGSTIAVDMTVARNEHMDRIRAARSKEFQKLDAEFTKAHGTNDALKMAEVEAQRQALRDIPETFDLSGATTPEELYALWPANLTRPV
jgi:hypothetical protein